MRYQTFLVLLVVSGLPLWAQQVGNYKATQVGVLPVGSGEGQVGYMKSFGEGGGFPGPTDCVFSPAGDLYVSDHINSRIDVFDPAFSFVRSVRVKELGDYPVINRLEVNQSGEMLAVVDLGGLYILDKDGKVLFTKRQGELPRKVTKTYDVFFYGDGVLYSDDNSKYHILDRAGRELPDSGKTRQWDTMVSRIETLFRAEKGAAASIVNSLRGADIVWDNGRLLTTDFTRQRRLWDQFRNLAISKTPGKDTTILDRVSDAIFFGFDADANSYWVCFEKGRFNSRFVLIMSPFGDVVENFVSDMLRRARPMVAPNGDIYFLVAGEDGVVISKIARVW